MSTIVLFGLAIVITAVLAWGPDRKLLWPQREDGGSNLHHPALRFLHDDPETTSDAG